jgi:hypothetical protein
MVKVYEVASDVDYGIVRVMIEEAGIQRFPHGTLAA